MTHSPWERPSGQPGAPPGPAPAFDVPLEGPTESFDDATGVPPVPQPNWRKIAGLSTLGGIAIGIVAAVLMVRSGGESADGAGTLPTSSPGSTASVMAADITTPPTLAPLTPPASAPLASAPAAADDTTLPTLPDRQVTLETTAPPTLPDFTVVAEPPQGSYDLTASVAASGVRPLRTTVTLDDVESRLVIEVYDNPDGQRDAMTARSDAVGIESSPIDYVFDHESHRIFVRGMTDADTWELATEDELLAGEDAADMADFVHTLASPLLTPDVIAAATVDPGEFVVLDVRTGATADQVTRRYRLRIDPALLTERSIITQFFGPEAFAGDSSIEVDAFVTPDDRLALTTVRFDMYGSASVAYLVNDSLAEPWPVDLPPLDQIVDDEYFS